MNFHRDRNLIILSVLFFAIIGSFLLGCSEGSESSPIGALIGNVSDGNIGPNKIIGCVLNSVTNEAMPNVYVKLYDEKHDFVNSALSTSNGEFTFAGLANGSYTVDIKADGFEFQTPDPDHVEVIDGQTKPGKYVVFLRSTGAATSYVLTTVKGTVKKSDGTAAIKYKVGLYSDVKCTKPLGKELGKEFETLTLGDGSFTIFNVKSSQNCFIKVFGEKDPDTIYPIGIDNTGKVSPSNIAITIQDGGVSKEANKIKGLVINASTNEMIANTYIQLYKNEQFVNATLSDASGNYTFNNLDNGVYTLKIAATGYEFQSPEPASCTVYNGHVIPDNYPLYLKPITTGTSEVFATISGVVRNTDNSSTNDYKVILCFDPEGKNPVGADFKTLVLGDGSFSLFNVTSSKNYFIKIADNNNENDTKAIYPIGIDKNGNVSPANIIITINTETKPDKIDEITFSVTSAYTGAPLELATVNINGANVGTTNINGELILTNQNSGFFNIIISKNGYENLVTTKKFDTDDDGKTIAFTMVEDTKDGYGSITGRYVDIDDTETGVGGLYVRLYRMIERTQSNNDSKTNIKETWYDVDKKFILTTKTSKGDDGLVGSFKLTHIEPGYYQLYISETSEIPETEQRSQVYDEFTWTQLKKGANCQAISQPFKVENNQTTYWTNYEQGKK